MKAHPELYGEHTTLRARDHTVYGNARGTYSSIHQLAYSLTNLLTYLYQAGDGRGPAGTLTAKGLSRDQANTSSWFVVYRPCSRDSIAKMLGRVGVGKGLNIKGTPPPRRTDYTLLTLLYLLCFTHTASLTLLHSLCFTHSS